MKKSQNKFSGIFILVCVILLLLITFVVSMCNKPKVITNVMNTTDEAYELPCDDQQVPVQPVPIVYVPMEPTKKDGRPSWIPPVELLPSLVTTKIQPPWRPLCLNC